jgi:hypothetical protein
VGSVHIAGDVIAWEVYTPSSNGLGSAEIRMRNVGTMALAVALLGLEGLDDLSTSYALGFLLRG